MTSVAYNRLGGLIARSLLLALGLLLLHAVSPSHAHAADLFPVDDWVGDGLEEAKDTVFGGLEIGAEAIADLIVNTFAALVELLIPDAFVDAGIEAIKWLCTVPTFAGGSHGGEEVLELPHVNELRNVLTWFGVALLPLGLVYAGGRSILTPSTYGDSPQDVVLRVLVSAAWLAFYVWAWEAIAQLSTFISNGVLSLSFVNEGIENMMGALGLAGGAVGPVSEFAVLILLLVCAIALIALLIFKIALVVITAFLFVVGGLIGALYPFPFGRKLVGGYLVGVVAVVSLPAIWAILFALGAALMVDVTASGGQGFAGFVKQFWVLGAALAVFGLSIKIALGALGLASSTISSFATGALAGGGGGPSPSGAAQKAHGAATAHNMRNASSQRSASMGGRAGGGDGQGVQRSQEAAEGLRGAMGSSGAARTAATAGAAAATGGTSAAAGAAAKAGGSAAAGQGAGAASTGAASRSAQRAAAAAPTRPAGIDNAPSSVRDTAPGEQSPAGPGGASAPAPRESARRTSAEGATQSPAPKAPRSSQAPPSKPRQSRGGKP